MATDDRTDIAVLREVLEAVSGRPALAAVHATASALLADLDPAGGNPAGDDPTVPPGDIPDVDVPQTTRPRIDRPLGDPPGYSPFGGTPGQGGSGIVDAELVGDDTPGQPIGSGRLGHESPTGFTEQGVPTWDSVRDKVETRTTTALGQEELDHSTPAGRTLDEQWNEREAAGRKKLDEIRRSMKDK